MFTRSTIVLVAGALVVAAAHGGRAKRTIDTVSYGGFNMAMPTVLPVFRGITANFVVNGDLVDLSTGVEVKTSGGQAANGVSVTITAHSKGPSTACQSCAHLTIRLTSTNTAPFGVYKILIHYLVEVQGPDEFDVRMFDHGTVSSVAITAPAPLANGAFLVGDNLTVRVQGTGLGNAAVIANGSADAAMREENPHGMQVVQTVAASASSATFTVRFDSSGIVSLPAGGFLYDKNLDQGSNAFPGAFYGGSGSLPFVLRLQPKVASASPGAVTTGSPIALSGTRLAPKGYSAFVDFVPKYKSSTSQVATVIATPAAGGLQIAAPATPVAADGAVLRYTPSTGTRDSLASSTTPVPPIRVVGLAPNIASFDSVGGAGARRPMIKVGQQTVAGKNLVPDQATTTTTTTTKSGSFGGVDIPTITATINALPTLSFGAQGLSVQSVGYRSTATRLPGLIGADSLIFSVPGTPAFSDTLTSTLTIATPAGSQATQNVIFVPPPTVTDVRTFNTAGIEVSIPIGGGTLVRGRQYRLRGKGLVVLSGPVSGADVVRATLNGAALVVTLATAPNVDPVIAIPLNATSGGLAVSGPGGSSNVGSFVVTDPPTALTIAGLSVSPTSVTGGQDIVATVAINGTVPPGGNAGNIAFTMATPSAAIVLPTGLIPVTSNPLVVRIPTKAVAAQQAPTIRVSSDPNAAQPSTSIANVTLTPPNPTSVVFAPSSVAGGATARGVVHFNTTAPLSSGLTAALVNSDPTSATVPATATMTGDTAVFNVSTAVVPADRTVTVTATIGGVSQSGTFTIRAAALSTVSVVPASLVPGSGGASVAVALTAPVPAPTTASVTCDPALVCPSTLTFAQNQTTASFLVTAKTVPASIAAPVSVTLNGVAKQASITLTPLAMQTLTVSPAIVQAGSPSSLTIQLNAPVPNGQTVDVVFSSSNASAVPAPASITFGAGQVTRLVNLPTHGPVAGVATVTFTVTLSQATSTTPNTSSKTATLSLTP